MVFFSTAHQNLWTCAIAMIVLNYDCAITSYSLMIRNKNDPQRWVVISLLAGLLVGQITFGVFGGTLSRQRSFLCSCCILFVGTILCILPSVTETSFGVARFLLGVGAGGIYPLISTISHESNQKALTSSIAAHVFGPVGSIGVLLAPVVVCVFLSIESLDYEMTWRLCIAIGALPVIVLASLSIPETLDLPDIISPSFNSYSSSWKISFANFASEFQEAVSNPLLRLSILGLWLCSFLGFFILYGNIFLQARLVEQLVEESNSVDDLSIFGDLGVAVMGAVCSLCFWFGGFISNIVVLPKISALAVLLQGFVLAAVMFFSLALMKAVLSTSSWRYLFGAYAFTNFIIGYGLAPSISLLPSLLFSPSIRTSLNGVFAVGATLGGILGVALSSSSQIHISGRMACFGGVSLLGVACTLILIRNQMQILKSHQPSVKTTSVSKWLQQGDVSETPTSYYYHYSDDQVLLMTEENTPLEE